MDFATLIGFVGIIAVLLLSIVLGDGGGIMLFVNAPSLGIVIGGTLMATLIQFPFKHVMLSFKHGTKVFLVKIDDPSALIADAVEMSGIARKQGLLALEQHEVANPFLAKGVRLVVDGHQADLVRRILTSDIDQTIEWYARGAKIFKAGGDVAPAMGMIGTLIGLVQMLSNMSDPGSIGPAMAVALLTTLYGAVIANAFMLPVAEKLSIRAEEEYANKILILEGIAAIQEGLNPMVTEELLKTFLSPYAKAAKAAEKE
ncbi:MAG: MotA/TolQ/ExbB proton channel family protein [Gammaproteobacteria bacterium]|nr:MotA/TolQ/ExbB proton channel family protein [Gammaproteobacteria bacterium]